MADTTPHVSEVHNNREPSPTMAPPDHLLAPPKRRMRWGYIVVVVIILAIVGALYYYRGMFIAATVNGSPISRLSVVREVEKQLGAQALDDLITQKLIQDEAHKKGITVSDQEISDQIKKIGDSIAAQGSTLADLMKQQGVTEADLRSKIAFRKTIEKLLGDQMTVSDADVDAYIKDNKSTFPSGTDVASERAKIQENLRQQKFGQLAQTYVTGLKSSAKINYFVHYQQQSQ